MMTDEELEAIRERNAYALVREPVDTTKFARMVASLEDMPALLTEVERLRERDAAMREIVGRVVALDDGPKIHALVYNDHDEEGYDIKVMRPIIEQSRALLAKGE